MGSQQPPLATLFLLGMLGEYPAGASARVPGLRVQGGNVSSSLGLFLGSAFSPLRSFTVGGVGANSPCSALSPACPTPVPQLCFSLGLLGLTVSFQARSMINQTQPRNQVVQPPLMRASPCRCPCPMSVQPLLGCLWRPENRHLLGSSNDALGRAAEAGWGRPLGTHLSRCQRGTS